MGLLKIGDKMNKKGYLHHWAGGITVGIIIGAVLMYLVAKKIIPIGLKVCG